MIINLYAVNNITSKYIKRRHTTREKITNSPNEDPIFVYFHVCPSPEVGPRKGMCEQPTPTAFYMHRHRARTFSSIRHQHLTKCPHDVLYNNGSHFWVGSWFCGRLSAVPFTLGHCLGSLWLSHSWKSQRFCGLSFHWAWLVFPRCSMTLEAITGVSVTSSRSCRSLVLHPVPFPAWRACVLALPSLFL